MQLLKYQNIGKAIYSIFLLKARLLQNIFFDKWFARRFSKHRFVQFFVVIWSMSSSVSISSTQHKHSSLSIYFHHLFAFFDTAECWLSAMYYNLTVFRTKLVKGFHYCSPWSSCFCFWSSTNLVILTLRYERHQMDSTGKTTSLFSTVHALGHHISSSLYEETLLHFLEKVYRV